MNKFAMCIGLMAMSTALLFPMGKDAAHGDATISLNAPYWTGRIGQDHSTMQNGYGHLSNDWYYLNNTTERINDSASSAQLFSALRSTADTNQGFVYRDFQAKYETYPDHGGAGTPSYGYMDWSLSGQMRGASDTGNKLAVLGLNSIDTTNFYAAEGNAKKLDWLSYSRAAVASRGAAKPGSSPSRLPCKRTS